MNAQVASKLTIPLQGRGRSRLGGICAAIALTIAVLAPSGALAAAGSGSVTMAVGGEGKGAKKLKRAGVKAIGVKGASGRGRVTFPVTELTLGPALTVELQGSLRFRGSGKSVEFGSLQLLGSGQSSRVTTLRKGKRIALMDAAGAVGLSATGVRIEGAGLRLSKRAARILRKLEMRRPPTGLLGSLEVGASMTQTNPPPEDPTDPYAAVCDLGVSSRSEGGVPGPEAPPALASPVDVAGGVTSWRFASSFSQYVIGAGGSIVPIAPGSMDPDPVPPSPPPIAPLFSYGVGDGEYEANDPTDGGDDQAIIEADGEIVFCHKPHGFRVTLSNPTVTIDGADSRLTVDVDTNMSGAHTPAQRVDLATLDLTGVDPFYNASGTEVSWADVPVTLTGDGEAALQLCNPMNPGPCDYEQGDQLEPITVSLETAAGTEAEWPFTAACVPQAPGTATTDFPPLPSTPLEAPELTAPVAASAGTISWGVRRALRSTVNTGGGFSFEDGAFGTSANPPDVDFGDQGDFFTWVGGSGEYEAPATPGQSGRLVLSGTGTVGICQGAAQGNYSLVVSDPRVVLDGDQSRLSAHVAARLGPSWTSGRVDLVAIDADDDDVVVSSAAGPEVGEQTITWSFPDLGADDATGPEAPCTGVGADPNADNCDSVNSNVTLSSAGTSALWLLANGSPTSAYRTAGSPLNALTVTAVVPAP